VKAGAGVARVKQMTNLERHAELVYAETSLMKALLAIIAGGDWLGLVKEAYVAFCPDEWMMMLILD